MDSNGGRSSQGERAVSIDLNATSRSQKSAGAWPIRRESCRCALSCYDFIPGKTAYSKLYCDSCDEKLD